MKTKVFALLAIFSLSVFAAPSCFALPEIAAKALAFFYTKPGQPYIFTKAETALPLKKDSKSVICSNRNFYDTQKFGNALCAALDGYSFDCMVKLAEFVPKEEVVGYDYVWTFQVTSWKDKNLDDVPEKVKANVLLYDRDYKLLLKSSVQIRKSKDPQAPNCLEFLTQEYVKSLFTEVVEDLRNDSDKKAKAAEKRAKKERDKKKNPAEAEEEQKSPENEKQAE